MERDLSPEEIEKHNNRKLTADKIRQILSKVMETPSQSSKRWIWELIQNAKDVPNRYGEVSIKIELTENSLLFEHNGNPFSLKNIMGLIQQVSSKDSTNSDKDVTGKFGTGFISTHLLSRKIYVSGIVLHNRVHREFNIVLDRSGDSSEDLIPKINTALEHISQIDKNEFFPIKEEYELYRKEDSFDTKFIYELFTDNSKKWALEGINDLVNTLPQTLIFIEKIKKVIVINNGIKEVYEKSRAFNQDGIYGYKVDINDQESKSFLTYNRNDITLAAEVNGFNPITLLENFGSQPNLYRDFPLIGSEKFYFPFILNGHTFNPTEDRDSIVLHSEESIESIENRKSIEKAINLSLEFTQWLVNNNAVNRHICAFTRRPVLKSTWQEFSKNWFTEIQSSWREKLVHLTLFETEQGRIIELKSAIIPEDGDTEETKLDFYDLIKPILHSNRVPKKDKLFDWLKVLGPKSDQKQRETWGTKLFMNAEDLALIINNYCDKETILNKSELNDIEKLNSWLTSFYDYLIKTEQISLFSEYNLIPNHYGKLKKLTKLHLEDREDPIPDRLLDILEKLGENWREDLVDRDIIVNQNIQSKGCSQISDSINEILRAKQSNFSEYSFLNRSDAREILTDILKLQPQNYSGNGFQYKLLELGQDIFKSNEKIALVDNLKHFSFSFSIRLFIILINMEIQSLGSLKGLENRLEMNEEDVIFWLNKYLNLIQSNSSYKVLLEEDFRIIPNRYKDLISYKSAKSFGTEETPLDDQLVNILHKIDKTKDWKEFLSHDGINIDFIDKCKFEELSKSIEDSVSKIQANDYNNPEEGILDKYKVPILDLIEWVENDNNKILAASYFSTFLNESKSLLFKLTVGNTNIGISTIKMLQDEAHINLLTKINQSNVPTEDISELIDIVIEL